MRRLCILVLFKGVECVGRFCSWLVACFALSHGLENEVLRFMAEDPYWHTARNVSAEIRPKTVASFSAAFSPADLKDWPRIKAHAASLWYEIRDVWRRWMIEEAVKDLWRRGLLQRVPSKPKYYRIRFS
jgi:hypothetical protein